MAGMAKDRVFAFAPDRKEALAQQLREDLRSGDVVLIKGSRGMHMETLVDALRAETVTDAKPASTDTASTTAQPGGNV
jgi:hypothetical protein